MKRLPLTLPLLALLAGCATASDRDPADAARRTACRADSERMLLQRDRGQMMRADEADSRLGTSGSVSGAYDSERLGQRFELGQMTDDCVRSNAAAPGQVRRGP